MRILPVEPNNVAENWRDLLFQVGVAMAFVFGILIALPVGVVWIAQNVLGMTHMGARSLLSVFVVVFVGAIPLFIIREWYL